jgi:ribosome-associated protein
MNYGIEKELIFDFARSSSSGGQNVNKVSSKVQIKWDLDNSLIFNPEQKLKIKKALKNNITKEGFVFLDSEVYREQLKNKIAVVEKLNSLITNALKVVKHRKPTRPSISSKEKRISDKKQLSTKKQSRQNLINF